MKTRPLIGINMDFRATVKGRAPFSTVHSGYYDCVLASEGVPVLIPPLIRPDDLTPIRDRLDGIILTGGDDMDPVKMNLGHHPSVTVMNERRETSDRLLCKMILANKIPVLAVGVGMQELNVVAGGGNYLHLPEDLPKCIPHRDPQGGLHRHIVTMVPGSLLEEIYGPDELCVTSYHHQGVRKLASAFRAGAHSPDGLIEGYESKDQNWFAVGVQWHPENEGNISLDTQLFEAFLAASAGVPGLSLAKAS
jgi:putative glutamine amidotransferase